jgi:hypothetical protein
MELKQKILAASEVLKCPNLKKTPNMRFVGEGVANKVFIGCIDLDCKNKAAFRIMPISKKYPLNNSHPVNVEMKLYQKFNKINANYIIPHLPMLIKNFRCKYSEVLPDKSATEEYEKLVNSKEIHPEVNIMILEFCRGGSIKDFVTKYKKNIKYLSCGFFQVLLCLVVLQYHLKNFRHNDLHNNNVNLDLYSFPGEEKYLKKYKKQKLYIAYHMFGRTFYIPYYGFCMKLIDFDVSCSQKTPNSKVSIDKVYKQNGVTCKPNPVFDSHLILNSCTYKFFQSYFLSSPESNKLHPEMVNFIERNIPSELRGFNTDKLGYARIKEIKSIPPGLKTPIQVILEDPLFAEYQQKPKSGSKIIMVYDTKVPSIDKLRTQRPEMFI